MRIGIDAGGTFTDFIAVHDSGAVETFKLRSNPLDPARVILEGLDRIAGSRSAEVIHGSTVGANALLERKGARACFVTTAGFEDLLHIGRQNRAALYDLTPPPRRYLIPRQDCFGVDERAHFDGTVERRPQKRELARLRSKLRRAGYESVAICFLHAWRDAENERAAEAALEGLGYVCASYDVCPEFREFERGSTALINAYVGPPIERYLSAVERGARRPVAVMQSNGGLLTSKEAARYAVRTILSGPAGGAIGAFEMARAAGFRRIVGFDMGGTSTDVSLSVGRPRETTGAWIDGFPIQVPMLDIHTVGAGGGSLARVDEGGLLRVGPESAGAVPGPACYGIGEEATVTDAHVALGRIGADQLAGGAIRLDAARAHAAVARIAARLGIGEAAAAEGILEVANANMERAIRVVSVERGHDPGDFALVAFGGCGGLHACEAAAQLAMRTVVVPRFAGALSALGMLLADRVRDFARGALHREDFERLFAEMERRARRELPRAALTRLAAIRYAGQSYELDVPWNTANPGAPFHREHRRVYGYSSPARAIEIVTLRVRARLAVPKPALRAPSAASTAVLAARPVFFGGKWRKTRVQVRESVSSRPANGPALVLDYGATTFVPPGWRYHRNGAGALIIQNKETSKS